MSLLSPDDVIAEVQSITPEWMAARGLRGLLLDLDNTLVPYGSTAETPAVQAWVGEMASSGLKVALLSNATVARATSWSQRFGVAGVGLAGKPNPRAFSRGAAVLGLPPHQVAMVGDQLFTDVLGGNAAGLHTVLVHPLSNNALPHTRLARWLEARALARRGVAWGPQHWSKH